jgi:hypothetical protein
MGEGGQRRGGRRKGKREEREKKERERRGLQREQPDSVVYLKEVGERGDSCAKIKAFFAF